MKYWQFFPYAVAALETAAAVVFAYRLDTRMTLIWVGYAVAAWALAGVR
jgi:hypothetical protein